MIPLRYLQVIKIIKTESRAGVRWGRGKGTAVAQRVKSKEETGRVPRRDGGHGCPRETALQPWTGTLPRLKTREHLPLNLSPRSLESHEMKEASCLHSYWLTVKDKETLRKHQVLDGHLAQRASHRSRRLHSTSQQPS